MRIFLLIIAVLIANLSVAFAQVDPLNSFGKGKEPLEIESDQGMELFQERQLAIARGNVLVRQGKLVLRADLVSASYRDVNGRRSIHRLDAVGNVRINTGKERMFGEHATYDLERELFLLTGTEMRIEAEEQTVYANESIEYWGKDQRAVARGEARAVQNKDNTTLRADVIEAQLAPKAPKPGAAALAPTQVAKTPAASGGLVAGGIDPEQLSLDALKAWGNVVITTANEVVRGDSGVYDAGNKVATLDGNVRITRGKNQLNGARAVIDLDKGVSRLIGQPGKRVRSIFYPGTETDNPPTPQQPRVVAKPIVPRPRPDGAQ
ncbi:MAG: LptA/OstA family protein [Alphaproteobacteria bacterium]|jgi:lipopolysaccharide export system protein LptA